MSKKLISPLIPSSQRRFTVKSLLKTPITCIPQAITQGGKYKLSEDKGGFLLEILKTETSDSGLYTCTVTNSAGSVSSSCKLTIKGRWDFFLNQLFSENSFKEVFLNIDVNIHIYILYIYVSEVCIYF